MCVIVHPPRLHSRIKIFKETKMYISLMLEDQKLSKQNYVKCDFMVIHNKVKNNRIWERPENQDIVIQANPNENIEAQREITQYITLKRFEGKNFGYYMIIPNLIDKIDSKKDDKRTFFLRVFASNQVNFLQLLANLALLSQTRPKEAAPVIGSYAAANQKCA